MSYREFSDESGQKWGVWFVSPSSAERRSKNRREVNVVAASSSGDRRVVPDRRRHPSRSRSAVAPGYEKGWLCFESENGEKRRLVWAPQGWDGLPTERLWVLCRVATSIVKPEPSQH